MTHKVFICYSRSHKDYDVAVAARAALAARRIPCWMDDRDVALGPHDPQVVVKAIDATQVVLLVFSRDANESTYVQSEIDRAVREGKIIFPLRIEDVEPSGALQLHLKSVQWVDGLNTPLKLSLDALSATIASALAPSKPTETLERQTREAKAKYARAESERQEHRAEAMRLAESAERKKARKEIEERKLREPKYPAPCPPPEPVPRQAAHTLFVLGRGAAGKSLLARLFGSNRFATNPSPVPSDKVHFSVSSPPAAKPGETFLIDVWAHLEQQRAEVERRIHLANPGIETVIRGKGPFTMERGTRLVVRLTFPDLHPEAGQDEMSWDGEITNASFTVAVPTDATAGPKPGFVSISGSGLQIARLPFYVVIGENVADAAPKTHSVHPIRKAFASYANQDRNEVLGRIQGMQKIAPDLDVFLDVAKLRSGQDWEQRLWREIAESDVLYLFWSAAAKESAWVEKEWRRALKTRGEEFIDPVPLVSPDLVRPPEELSKKHFNEWVLAYQRGKMN